MGRLSNQVAIITGGAKGIGAAFAEALAQEGAHVVVADILDGAAVVERLSTHGRAIFVKTDVASPSSVEAMAAAAMDAFGRIDILVNNAALFANLSRRPFDQIDPDEWDKVMAVNTRGPFLCARATVPHMVRQGRGKIVNIASGTVFKGAANMLHYTASKGAVVAMTRCLARELGESGITVNAIAPGLTMSEGVSSNPDWSGPAAAATVNSRAIKRPQQPDDLLGALLFLASAESDFVTGQTVVVDGGAVMS